MDSCTTCELDRAQSYGQWWHLRHYYGFSGYFCPDCHDKISHDSYGNPVNPLEYTLMLLKHNKKFG